MRFTLSRLLPRRRAKAHARLPDDRARLSLDRSALLAELEVSVPAPERIVTWDAAIRASASSRA
ncbi:MAG TPA: hypothetical protein VFB41_09895 [Solirubrobacteraceae bacterium]|nr:hypothetical protein [Solirubrobacteraceae bacterium]